MKRRKVLAIAGFLCISFAAGCTFREIVMAPLYVCPLPIDDVIDAIAPPKLHKTKWLGMRLEDINKYLANEYGISDNEIGVVVTKIKSGSPGEKMGFKEGDLIKEINVYETPDVDQLYRVVKKIKGAEKLRFGVVRNGDFYEMTYVPKEE